MVVLRDVAAAPAADLLLDDVHRDVRSLAREVAQGEIAPHAATWDAARTVPVDALRALAEPGLLGVLAPPELGGAGLDQTALCVIVEELARADAGVAVAVAVHNGLGIGPLVRSGTEAQREEWVPRLAAGESLAAFAVTEPGTGSDAASLRTAAVPDGDGGFTISGEKQWITNGGFADLFLVFARTDGPGAHGVSTLLVEPEDGVAVGAEIPKMGLHSSSTVGLAFDRVRVGAGRLLGERGEGLMVALTALEGGRTAVAAQAVGIAAAALDVAVAYARERTAFGGPIGRFQGVQFPLADVAARIEAARLLTYHAARLRDAGLPCGVEGAKAKLLASAVAVEAADVAVQTLGGYGYSSEYPAERLYRDAKVTEIYEGTSQIQRVVIARDLLGDAAR